MSLTGSNNEEKIWNYLIAKIKNPYGCAGCMGNMYAESGLRPNNLQNSYETKLGYTDESYTKAVDNGTYTNFVHDSAGYGLVQWTYWSLKEYLLNFAKSKNKSIGDLEMQLECVCTQLEKQYSSVWNTLLNAKSVLEASNAMLLKFERPADQSENAQKKRAAYGQTYYDKYAEKKSTKEETMSFVMRTTKPGKGNKYYITKANGGYSDAIKGSPTDKDCDVLSNCVGYAYGRFNEIGGYGYCKYLSPTNAENFIQYKGNLATGQTPKLGACMVWQKGSTLSGSDGAGHVAIVEKVISSTEVMTSESGWGCSTPFWTQTRKKGSGNWGQGSGYKFLGFIYNPAVADNAQPKDDGGSNTTLKYAVGNIVDFTGKVHYSSSTATSGSACTPGVAKVTAISKSAKHPYHLIRESGGGSTVYGWVDASAISGLHKTETKKEETKMGYTNSKLVSYTKLSPNHSGTRTHSIDRITPHCVVGQCSVETLGEVFYPSSRQASCQYGIGVDGRVGMYVEEKNRSWCSSSNANDQRAVTIECASDTTHPYAFKDVVYKKLITLCVDICKRNGKKKLLWLGGKGSTSADKAACENYTPKSDEMILTAHRFYANKSCPGDWMYARMGDLAKQVTAQLGGSTTPEPTKPTTPTTPTNNGIKAGSVVKIASNAVYYNGKAMPNWVKAKNWIVHSLSGDRVVIDKSQDGKNSIMSAVNIKYLSVVSNGSSSGGTTTPTFTPYKVRVTADVLNIRKGAGTNYGTNGAIKDKSIYTIVKESKGTGATKWGFLKSGAGWISLDFCKKV
jgi:hypothetical protein